jgi:isocitrate dehydrogenase (NAD+)
LLLAALLMLDHIGETEAATRIHRALLAVLATPAHTTRDLGGSATTTEFADAICRELGSASPVPNP